MTIQETTETNGDWKRRGSIWIVLCVFFGVHGAIHILSDEQGHGIESLEIRKLREARGKLIGEMPTQALAIAKAKERREAKLLEEKLNGKPDANDDVNKQVEIEEQKLQDLLSEISRIDFQIISHRPGRKH